MSGLFQDDPIERDEAPPPPVGPGLFGNDLPVALPEPVNAAPYRVLARKYRPVTFEDLIGQFPSYTKPETGVIKAIVEVPQ